VTFNLTALCKKRSGDSSAPKLTLGHRYEPATYEELCLAEVQRGSSGRGWRVHLERTTDSFDMCVSVVPFAVSNELSGLEGASQFAHHLSEDAPVEFHSVRTALATTTRFLTWSGTPIGGANRRNTSRKQDIGHQRTTRHQDQSPLRSSLIGAPLRP
jgi:hypothetical protein